MKRPPMKLLNCTRCDDVLQIIEQQRFCVCGRSQGSALVDGGVSVTGPARLLTLDWEVYDGLVEGGEGRMSVLPRDRYRK